LPPTPPPNESLAALASDLGDGEARSLVRTYLREFPLSLQQLGGGDRPTRHRLAHSMKSNSRLVGALALSQRMAALELRLAEAQGPDVTPEDLTAIAADFEAAVVPLRAFVAA